jgi:hypothetical protein
MEWHIYKSAAHTGILRFVLREMYPVAGITDHVTPTSIRRGFADDLSRVARLPRSNIELVRRALGVSKKNVTE